MVMLALLLSYFILLTALVLGSAAVLRRKRAVPQPEDFPAVTIVKPLCGWSASLKENLTSFFTVDYPGAIELIFVAKDPHDPALDFARELGRSFPNRTMRCSTTANLAGWQPKTASMETGLQLASANLLVFADDDVTLSSATLKGLVKTVQQEGVGASYTQPFIVNPAGMGGVLEACLMNYSMHIIHPHLERTGWETLAGNAFAVKKSALSAAGGFASIRHFIADDVMLGKTIQQTGQKLCLAPCPVAIQPGPKSFTSFLNHQLRWLRVWRLSVGWKALLGFFYSSTFFIPLLLFIFHLSVGWVAAFACVEMAISFLIQRVVLRQPANMWIILLTPFVLWLQQVLVFVSFLSNHVRWRGNHYHLGRDGRIKRITPINGEAIT